MKILHTVEFYYPSIGGSQEVVRQISERIVAMGHDVTVATSFLPDRHEKSLNGVKIRQFNISGNEVRGYIGDVNEYQDFILKSDFDVIMNYAAQEWTADLIFPLLDKLSCRKIFVPCGFSALHNAQYQDYFSKMPGILRQYDATIYLGKNYRDIRFARKHKIKNLHIIPNGADEKEFLSSYQGDIKSELHIDDGSKIVMHLGGVTGLKGQAEAMAILNAADIKNVTLLLIGNIFDHRLARRISLRSHFFNLLPRNRKMRKRIQFLQLDRARTVAALQASDVFLFPSNVEASPLVLFEACAAKTPFLSTDVGNAKEIIKWTNGGILLPTQIDENGYSHAKISESAGILEKILHDDSMLNDLSSQGYAAWNRKFRWDKIAKQYLKLYRGNK